MGLAASLAACSPGYVARAGWEEAKILRVRRPIQEVVHDTAVDAVTRAKLRLVQDARAFAELELGLDAGRSFLSYAPVERDTLLLVVSAAPEFRLEWKTWWFPIVGRVPYRGYFDFEAAHRAADRLAADGWDTYVRPTTAFSTLGWLPDPLLSTVLAADSITLVETVIHEITHTTFFPSGQAHFNESFANFVGYRGAIEFFCGALAAPDLCGSARDRWHDVLEFGRFFQSIVEPLEALYSDASADEAALRAGKREILEDAARRWREDVKPRLRSGEYGDLDPADLNNAWLLSRILYYTRLDDFETLLGEAGGLRPAVAELIAAAGDRDPWDALDGLVAGPAGPRAGGEEGR